MSKILSVLSSALGTLGILSLLAGAAGAQTVAMDQFMTEARCDGYNGMPGYYFDGTFNRISIGANNQENCSNGTVPRELTGADTITWQKADVGGSSWWPAFGAILLDSSRGNFTGVPANDVYSDSFSYSHSWPADINHDAGQASYRYIDSGGNYAPPGFYYRYFFPTVDWGNPGNIQYFTGPDCNGLWTTSPPGWYVMSQYQPDSTLQQLWGIDRGVTSTTWGSPCPQSSPMRVTTQYFPNALWTISEDGVPGFPATIAIPTIVSTNYLNTAYNGSTCVERYYYGKYLGLLAYENFDSYVSPGCGGGAVGVNNQCGFQTVVSGFPTVGAPPYGAGSWGLWQCIVASKIIPPVAGATNYDGFFYSFHDNNIPVGTQGHDWPGKYPLYWQ